MQGAGACALLGARAVSGAEARPPYAWRNLPFGGGGFVDGFAFHPRERGLLYARTDIGGAYRWDAAQASWIPLLDHLGRSEADLMGVLGLALDPNDAERVYLACGLYTNDWNGKGAVLASTDRGATWQHHGLPVKLGGNEPGRGSGERLQVDPRQGEVLLLGTTRDGLMRSSDRGRSFTRLPFAGKHVTLVLFDAASSAAGTPCTTFYVGCHDQPGLHVTRDGGRTFAREPGTPAQVPQRAAFGPDGTLVVSFATGTGDAAPNPGNAIDGGVWKRDPGGRWTEITPAKATAGGKGFGYGGVDVDARGRIVVSTIERWAEGDDVYLSTDGGARWTALGTRSRHDTRPFPWLADYTQGREAMGHWIADIKLDPHDPQRAVYGTGFGVWMTSAFGAAQQDAGVVRWDFAVTGLEETAALDLHSPSGGVQLFGAMGDVAGGAWDDLGKTPQAGVFAPTRETNRGVDAAWLAPGIVARTSDGGSGGYVSTSGGAQWRPFGPSPRAPGARGGRIAVSAKGTALVWTPERQPAMWSHDRGKTWSPCAGWPGDRDAVLVPLADRTVDAVFYVHDPAAGEIRISVDGGRSFATGITGLTKVDPRWQSAGMAVAPGKVRDLWVALPDGLLHLPGLEGRTKIVRGVEEAWLVALGKGAPGAAYHSVYVWGRVGVGAAPAVEGLFRSDDAGGSFRRIDDDRHRYGRLLALAADPLEHGTVYVAPHGRGIIMGRPRA